MSMQEIVSSSDLKKYDHFVFTGDVGTHTVTYEATRLPKASWDMVISHSNKQLKQQKITNSKGLLNFINKKITKWYTSGTLKMESENCNTIPMEYKF